MQLDYASHGGKGLSYSRCLTLRRCPRKFQLDNILCVKNENRESVTFSFGHAVGAGVQHICAGSTLERAIAHTIANWGVDIYECSDKDWKSRKSLWFAIEAVRKFHALYTMNSSPLKDYEMAVINGKPAIELTFSVDIGDGYTYEGHIDGILKHKTQNRYMVLELKTSAANYIEDAMYKNSDQSVGYSTVLDKIAETLDAAASFTVLYVIYKSKAQEYVFKPFTKSVIHRANWVNSVLFDKETAMRHAESNFYPMRGEACFDFFKECEYFQKCQMSDETLERGKAEETTFTDLEQHDFEFTLEEVIEHQLEMQEKEIIPVVDVDEVDMILNTE